MTTNSAEFWDRIAPDYSKQPISDTQTYERKLALTRSLMRRDMRVLEFGCGTGSTALKHAPYVAHIDATDLSAGMIEIGRQKAEQANVQNIRFIQSGIEAFESESAYDMVLALNLLHLVRDRTAALDKIFGLLKPGGLFVSSTVCLADKMWFLRPVIPVMQWLGKAPYVSFASASDVQSELEAAGFRTEEHWTHGRANSLFAIASKPDVSDRG